MNSIIARIMEEFGLPEALAIMLVRSAPHRYKVFKIEKRTPGTYRTIAQPSREIKALQRWVVSDVLSDLPVHTCATAYKKDSGIKRNAQAHVANQYLLKMDFKDFFPSIDAAALKAHITTYVPDRFSADEIESICRIVLWMPRHQTKMILSIGGPSSPFISNSIMFEFDRLVNDFCTQEGAVYTRYADDLAISTNVPGVLNEIKNFVEVACKKIAYPKIAINQEKTISTSKKHLRKITGLVISSEGKISLGRERKREIRSMLHHVLCGRLSKAEIQKVRGLLAFAIDVEPEFVARMKKKYGESFIQNILSMPFSAG